MNVEKIIQTATRALKVLENEALCVKRVYSYILTSFMCLSLDVHFVVLMLELCHEKTSLKPYVNNKSTDQPA